MQSTALAKPNANGSLGAFSFDGVPETLAARMKRFETGTLKNEKEKAAGVMLRLGAELKPIRDDLAKAGRKGKFAPWLESVRLTVSYAYACIGVYEAFGNLPSVGRFDTAALVMLARKKTPLEARKTAIERAESGERISVEYLKEERIIGKSPLTSRNGRPTAQGQPTRGPTFDTAALDAKPPRVAKVPKSGKPIISKEQRTKLHKSVGDIIRTLHAIGVYDQFASGLRLITDWLKTV